jgi:hypothetical protein
MRRGARPYGPPAARRCKAYGLVTKSFAMTLQSATVGSIETGMHRPVPS